MYVLCISYVCRQCACTARGYDFLLLHNLSNTKTTGKSDIGTHSRKNVTALENQLVTLKMLIRRVSLKVVF